MILHCRRFDLQKRTHGNMFHPFSTALSDTRSAADKYLRTGTKQRNSNVNLGRKRRNSVLDSGHYVRFLDCSGSSSTSTRYNSKLWIQRLPRESKIIQADVKRKINFLEENQYKNKRPALTHRYIMYQIFSFFIINTTEEHTMNLNDLLNVELYNDNLQMFVPSGLGRDIIGLW